MAKLGLPRHRYTVAILCWLYVIISILMQIYFILDTFYGSLFVLSLINLAIGCFGLFSLYKENGTLMKIYGIILVVSTVLQVLETLGLLVLILLRERLLNLFLTDLMDKYYDSDEDREIMDDLQKDLECCGRQSYTDWAIKPFSCCKAGDCSSYYTDGCVDVISPIVSLSLLVWGLLSIGIIIIHIYAVVSSFALARIYRQGPILPNIKHNLANF